MGIQVDPEWWKTLFDDVYLVTDARSVGDAALTRREIDVFCQLVPLKKEQRILDLCGGHGRHSLELSRRGFTRCTVLDYSETLLEIGVRSAKRAHCPVRFVQGDARDLQLASESYHHVWILGNSLGYAQEGDADLQTLCESYRVLKPGGWLLVDVADGAAVRQRFAPNAWHEIGKDIVVCRERELRAKRICAREMVLHKRTGLVRDRTYCMRLYSPGALGGMAETAGFSGIRVHTDFSPLTCDGDLGFMNHRMLLTAQKPLAQTDEN